MSYTIRQVQKPSNQELDEAAVMLAEAFDYSFFLSGLGGDKSLVVPILRAELTAGIIGGEVYFAEQPGVGIVGATVYFGPGQKFLLSDEQKNAGWNQVIHKLDRKFQVWWDYLLARYDELSVTSYGPGVKIGAYHCQLLGVSPQHQHRGIGGSLMAYAEAKARNAKVPSIVDTSRGGPNVSIYKSLGYHEAGSGMIKQPSENEFEMVFLVKHTDESE